MKDYVKISPADTVIVAVRDIKKNTVIECDGAGIQVLTDIPAGHKIAVKDINAGENIIKYGFPIGSATCGIKVGEHVHTHNTVTNLEGELKYTFKPDLSFVNPFKNENLSFMGYKRKNGDVGTRNELWIVPTVGCVNGIGSKIAEGFLKETLGSYECSAMPPGIDFIQSLNHPYGCGQEGYDADNTQNALAMAVKHPNAGGVLVLGLGCEDNRIEEFKKVLGEYDSERVVFLECQEAEDEITEGIRLMKMLYAKAKYDIRTLSPLSALRVGMECGGSDGFSGLTGNPLLGRFSDFMAAQGGSTVMTEVAEMFGSETILMSRAKDINVFNDIVEMINGYKEYCFSLEASISGNPSLGNLDGGITTLEEKALGCTQKGGMSNVNGVIKYAENLKEKGLNLLWAPGSDTAGTTALGLCCQIVIFTTGRGTPYGGFIPTVKVATNSKLYDKKKSWNDFNAGSLLEGNKMQNLLEEFIKLIIDVAEGKPTCAENMGGREFVIWKNGISE